MTRALIYISLAIGLLYVIRELEYAGVRKSENGEFAKLRTTFLEENNFDLLIIGSSRAECQFYTPIIDSATGLSCYNIGMTGATMPFIASTLQAYLVHSKAPKYIVLNLDLHSLRDNNDTVYKFPRYFPFLENETLYNGLQDRDDRFRFFKWLPFYSLPYFNDNYLSNSIHGWLGTPTEFDDDYIGGFSPSLRNPNLGNLDTATMIVTSATCSRPIWDALYQIDTICANHNCKLIMVISPLYYRQEEAVISYVDTKRVFEKSAQTDSTPFIDLGHDSLRFSEQYYSDPAHLNPEGAKEFTRRFCSELVQYLDK